MGEMCEGRVPSECYNSNQAQREIEAKKEKKRKKQEMSGKTACMWEERMSHSH